MKSHKFKPGMKLEVVDLEQPHIIRVATITNIMGRMLQLFFDGQSKFQFVDFESPDIYPIGWCKRTGHTLHTPFGASKFVSYSSHSAQGGGVGGGGVVGWGTYCRHPRVPVVPLSLSNQNPF